MDFVQIKVALEVARAKSFSEAASRLSYSESTVSKRVSSLEKELGVTLFERKTRSQFSLTPEGEELLPHLEKINVAYRGLVEKAGELKERQDNLLRVGRMDGVSTFGEEKLLMGFSLAAPSVRLVEVVKQAKELIENFRDGLVDVALIMAVDPDAEFRSLQDDAFGRVKIREYRMKVVVPERHPALSLETVTLRDFSRDTFLFRKYRETVEEDQKICRFVEACRSEGFEPKLKVVEANGPLFFEILASKRYVAPLMYRPQNLRPDVRFIQLDKDYYHFAQYAYYHKGSTSKALREFLDYLGDGDLPVV